MEWPQESCVYSLSSCQVSIRLLDNGWENSAGKFKKRQTSSHRFSVPARRSMLLLHWNIAFLFMIHQELDQSPECHWMSVTLWSWQTSEGVKRVPILWTLRVFNLKWYQRWLWQITEPRTPGTWPTTAGEIRSTEINVFLNPRWPTAPLAKIWNNSQESAVKVISIWARIGELWRIVTNESSWRSLSLN